MLPKLGKKAARKDPRTLKLEAFVDREALPAIPDKTNWRARVPAWPLYANDRIGCCAIATPAHQLISWTANDADVMVTPTEAQVHAEYQAVGGWNPDDPNTDNGCVMLDVLNRWRSRGLFGRPIGGYVAIDVDDTELIQAAIYLFGGVLAGFALPRAAATQEHWRVPNRRARRFGEWRAGSWGGHAVAIVDYDATDFTCITWGDQKRISYGFADAYCDEVYAAIAIEWLGPDNRAPNGFDAPALVKALADLGR